MPVELPPASLPAPVILPAPVLVGADAKPLTDTPRYMPLAQPPVWYTPFQAAPCTGPNCAPSPARRRVFR